MSAIAIVILTLLVILTLYFRINFANIKGSYGERKVQKILSRLDPTSYNVYHDLYVPTENNKTTQVDHIVTSRYGIFVIETKHYDGWIFGNEKTDTGPKLFIKGKKNYLTQFGKMLVI